MRAVLQRVRSAKVEVDGAITGAIDRGLLVYLGVGRGDDAADRAWMLEKLTGLRIFSNDLGKMDRSVLDVGGALLVVSQFTLFADTRRGRRPSFDDAMPPAEANVAYEAFVTEARRLLRVETGVFGADMAVTSLNDGPVTIMLDSTTRAKAAGA